MKYLRTVLVILLLTFFSSVYGGSCYDIDDCRVKAKQGDATAQYNLGLMYRNGEGGPENYKEAAKWFRKSAEQGFDKAQYQLGMMYSKGKGVPQDDVMAHMYWNVAAVGGGRGAIKERDIVAKKMTPSQIEKAQDLAREWMSVLRVSSNIPTFVNNIYG